MKIVEGIKSTIPKVSLLFQHIFSFETYFVLFIFSYQYKNAHPFFANPDITTVLIAALLPWSYIIWRREKHDARFWQQPLIALMFFSLGMILSLSLSPLPTSYHSTSKLLVFLIFTMPSFIFAYHIIACNMQRLERLFWVFIIFAIIVHVAAYQAFIKGNFSLGDVLGNNYLITGQTLGVGFILMTVLSFAHFEKMNSLHKSALFILWGTFVFIGINLGGRGPVLATLGALIFFYAYQGIKTPQRSLLFEHLLLFLIASFGIYWLLKTILILEQSQFYERLSSAIQETKIIDDSINLRLEYYKSAWRAFYTHPFSGLGIGNWPIFHGLGDVELHPHNIFLEIGAEMGIVGLCLFIGLIFVCCWPFNIPREANAYYIGTVLLLIFSFLNSLKSGDLNDNILFFVSLALLARQKRERLSA
jgi:O-antigen ligase